MLEQIGSEKTVRFYPPYDHNNPSGKDTVDTVLAITEPLSLYNHLRGVLINEELQRIIIGFEGDHGEAKTASYDFGKTPVIITFRTPWGIIRTLRLPLP